MVRRVWPPWRRQGYPNRLRHCDFLRRFAVLLTPGVALHGDDDGDDGGNGGGEGGRGRFAASAVAYAAAVAGGNEAAAACAYMLAALIPPDDDGDDGPPRHQLGHSKPVTPYIVARVRQLTLR